MAARSVIYSYPQWHTVSFSLIAIKHVEQLRKYTSVYEWDELAIPDVYVVSPFALCVHPAFSSVWRWANQIAKIELSFEKAVESLAQRFRKYEKVVGFDVADSDAVSDLALTLLEPVDEVAVPSEWSRQSFIRSGCKKPVRVLPHGLDDPWFKLPPQLPQPGGNQALYMVYRYKSDFGKKLLLFWLWHSPERKGYPEVKAFYEALRRERSDVALALKTGGPLELDPVYASKLNVVNVWGWLSDEEKMQLYDVADVTLLFSRGGAFELNGLESLARGVPVIAHRRGAWAEYAPEWCLVPEALKVKVFADNAIHVGYGYTIDVEKAVDRACEMLDNVEEWKARAKEYALKELSGKYSWDAIGMQLLDIVSR